MSQILLKDRMRQCDEEGPYNNVKEQRKPEKTRNDS